jgi:spore coat polysaccharide biosynthesis protein SpsF
MVGAIIQARMNSSRLPGKVLKPVLGRPLLELLVERLRFCRRLDDIIIATTAGTEDDPVRDLTERLDIKYVRGSEEDVLDRYFQAARQFQVDHIVRITGDCPLADPVVIDSVIEAYMDVDSGMARYDYLSNATEATFPDGLDVQIFSFDVLERLHQRADKKYQREHVCTYILEHPEAFRTGNMRCSRDLSRYRWTLDNFEDYELIKAIYEGLYFRKKSFLMEDILKFLEENPGLEGLNKDITRNEGFIRSLDRESLSGAEKADIIDKVMLGKKAHEGR